MRATLQSVAVGAVLLMLAIGSMPPAHAQAAFAFDLPAQPLADSLRAVASETHINIVFDPAVVAGITARPLMATATARQAIARLLTRTGLKYVAVGESTIRIARIVARDSTGAGSEAPPAAGQDGPSDTQSGSQSSESPSTTEQSGPPSAAGKTPAAELSEVVVTGTRIVGTTPTSPVLTLDRTAIDESGYSSIGQLLLTLPENFSGGQNPGVIGARGNNQFSISGASSANLFGLGADSTLTLVDGHRLAYDGYQNGVDLSLIPLAAVDRVEIMTDGGSAIYGSDAVAGVVNVILKQNYDGVTADARYGDVTSGQAGQAQYSVLAGHNWESGNVVVAYEYSHDDPLYASERPFSLGAEQPTTLFPELNRDSVFLSAHQSLSDWATASLDALYTSRSDVSVVTAGSTGDEFIDYAEVDVKEYGVSPGITVALPRDWKLSLEGTLAGDRDDESTPEYSAATDSLVAPGLLYFQNELRIGELQATGPLLDLPSGPLKLAVGAGYRYEGFETAEPTDLAQPATNASRNVRYAYGEIELPLVEPATTRTMLESLNLSAAYRYERYSDFGAQPTPKVGIAYVPVDFLHLRVTWSKSFRAPELEDVYGLRQLYLLPAPAFGGVAGKDAMLVFGSNPALGPETATSRTAGIDLTPAAIPGLKISPTYFYIDYSNRIVQPIADTTGSLTNPLYSAFISSNPTPAQQEALIAQSAFFYNFTGGPYDPASVADVLNDSYQNATIQRIHGVDLTVQDAWPILTGRLSVATNGAWLTVRQKTISTEPETVISGTIFNPPSFKERTSATWQQNGWDFTTAFNYVNWEWDNSTAPAVHVGSWNTVDAQLTYDFDFSQIRWLRGMKASLFAQNLLNRYPPFVAASSTTYPGLGYDSTNASPFGRFIGAYLSKSW
ncbi:MAG: TonB-dependent receptor [Steroidobacteraceae bacterium]